MDVHELASAVAARLGGAKLMISDDDARVMTYRIIAHDAEDLQGATRMMDGITADDLCLVLVHMRNAWLLLAQFVPADLAFELLRVGSEAPALFDDSDTPA